MARHAEPNELLSLQIRDVARLLRTRKVSPVELLDAVLARIESLNPKLNAFITVTAEEARAEARKAEREILRGRYRGPLHGVPIPVKDNFETKGIRTTAGSKILADYVPTEDADVVHALRRAGAVVVGKTNLHEFAYGITSENPHYGATRNPWDAERISGGSSGGSAVAVATGMGFGSVGTDTGGSIRVPASLCGIVGLKPTFGRVSCRGVIPLSRSLDHVGPLARSVADAGLLLGAIARKKHAFRSPFGARQAGRSPVRARRMKFKLGWPREFFFERVDEEVERAIRAAVKRIEKRGAQIEEVSLGHIGEAGEAGTQIALAEAREYHEAQGYYPARADEYGADVRSRLEQGASVRAIDYLRAFAARARVVAGFDAAFERVDAIIAPGAVIPAPPLGQNLVRIRGEELKVRAVLVGTSRPANLTGHPAISIPCGWTNNRLPIGLQLIGRHWDEARLLQIAGAMEEELADSVAAPYIR
ncbi:MAG: amidase [Candidatus Acidiferrales bacterium]